jgi:hypothetical protein
MAILLLDLVVFIAIPLIMPPKINFSIKTACYHPTRMAANTCPQEALHPISAL